MEKSERIDKYLWFVRVYKSRTVATEECLRGRVTADGRTVKPATPISKGSTITVRKPPVIYSYTVTGIPSGRVGAALAASYITDLTPSEEKEKLQAAKTAQGYRPRGSGRPTKRERRELDDFLE